MEMAPASGTSRPAIDLSNVVLPQPEGPKNERIPFSNSKLTLSRALTSLNSLIKPWTFRIAMLKYALYCCRPNDAHITRVSDCSVLCNKPTGKEYATSELIKKRVELLSRPL